MDRYDQTLDRIERMMKEMETLIAWLRSLEQLKPLKIYQTYLLQLEDKAERLTLLTRALPCYTG